jgi:hypothetical protein
MQVKSWQGRSHHAFKLRNRSTDPSRPLRGTTHWQHILSYPKDLSVLFKPRSQQAIKLIQDTAALLWT